jgi:hypothetical protein
MSITDMTAGHMMPRPGPASPTFGARRTPPPLPRQPREQLQWPFSVAVWDHLLPWVQALALALKDRAQTLVLSLKPTEAWSREAALRTLLQSDISATFVRILAYLGALGLLAIGAAEIFRASPVGAAIEPAPRLEWTTVAKPFPAFSLSMPELADSGFGYGMRRHTYGGGRRDILRWGELGGSSPHLTVEIYRPGTEFIRFSGAGPEIAERTEGLVNAIDIKPVGMLDSKFGSLSLVEFALNKNPTRRCLGFARPYDRPRMQITGWYCTSGPELIERDTVACALDRLTLLAAASDAKVGELFAHAELKRNFCGQKSPLLYATPKLGPQAAASPDVKLRGRLSAR